MLLSAALLLYRKESISPAVEGTIRFEVDK